MDHYRDLDSIQGFHMEVNGLEPLTSCLQSMRSTIELYPLKEKKAK